MPALRQLVRGLEVLFWALPAALVVCVAESVSFEWQSWGVLPLVLVMGLLWYGASRLKAFQPEETVWQSTVTITELLALALVGLAPFLHWFHHVPEIPAEYLTSGQKHISYCLVVFCSATIMFLLNLNHAIARLAAMVIAVEEDEATVEEAERLLSEQGVDNAVAIAGSVTEGAAKHGPFDVIVIEGAVEVIPEAIAGQLKQGGRIVAIFVENGLGQARVGIRTERGIDWRVAFDAAAPVLPGFAREAEFVF